ncbi:MAG: CoA-binding protein [Dehalococcoidia bacterium]|nr:CoA-binding protein [Dehalococcoidia bacterium]
MRSDIGDNVRTLFSPDSIAVFGSFKELVGLGWGLLKNLNDFGFKGRVYPVNPSYAEVMGLKVHPGIEEIQGQVDLAVIITPPPAVTSVVRQCAAKGVKAAVIVTENFAEADQEGARLQRELVEIRDRTGIRILGPNTVGVINARNGLITIPYLIGYDHIRQGGIAYCSQSGIAAAQCQPLQDRGYPISKMCDLGNKCDLDEVDMLEYFLADRETTVLSMHLEDVRHGREFVDAARRFTAAKPLIVFKPARTEAGARASASHTASLAGNDRIYDEALKQAGALRVDTWQEFWDVPKMFEMRPLSRGNRIGIVSHSGGAGVVAVDAAVRAGLEIAEFSPETISKLKDISPRLARNPVDLGPVLSPAADPFQIQEQVLRAVLSDPNLDCAFIVIYVGVLAPIQLVAEVFERAMKDISKPVAIWVYGTRLSLLAEMSRELDSRCLPTYTDTETALKALATQARYSRYMGQRAVSGLKREKT